MHMWLSETYPGVSERSHCADVRIRRAAILIIF